MQLQQPHAAGEKVVTAWNANWGQKRKEVVAVLTAPLFTAVSLMADPARSTGRRSGRYCEHMRLRGQCKECGGG